MAEFITFFEKLRRRTKLGLMNNICIVGEPRTGKSTLALNLLLKTNMEFYNHNYDFVRNLWTFDLFELKNMVMDRYVKTYIMFDEAGAQDTEMWNSFHSKVFRLIFEIFGKRQNHVIATVPSFRLFNTRIRTLFQWLIKVIHRGYAIVYRIQPDVTGMFNKPYRLIRTWEITYGLPPKDLVEEYEKAKDEFLRKKSKELDEMKKMKEKQERFDPEAFLRSIRESL